MTTVLVATLTVVVAVLALLVAGLLRSHAEILRRLHDLGAGLEPATGERTATGPMPVDGPAIRTTEGVPGPGRGGGRVVDIVGVTPAGAATVVAVGAVEHRTLLAFLSSGCTTCEHHWATFGDPAAVGLPPSIRLVIVTKDPEHESPGAIARLAPPAFPVVMSTAAFDAYDVPVSPYFVLVDGPSERILGEGAAARWPQVRDLLLEATDDQIEVDAGRAAIRRRGGRQGQRDRDADDALFDAGIVPGDPRLHHGADDS